MTGDYWVQWWALPALKQMITNALALQRLIDEIEDKAI